jgi:hypothetical protein
VDSTPPLLLDRFGRHQLTRALFAAAAHEHIIREHSSGSCRSIGRRIHPRSLLVWRRIGDDVDEGLGDGEERRIPLRRRGGDGGAGAGERLLLVVVLEKELVDVGEDGVVGRQVLGALELGGGGGGGARRAAER